MQQFQHNGQDRGLELGSGFIGSQIVVELDRGAVAGLAIVKQADKCRPEPGGLRLDPQRNAKSKDSTVVVNLGTVFLRDCSLPYNSPWGFRTMS